MCRYHEGKALQENHIYAKSYENLLSAICDLKSLPSRQASSTDTTATLISPRMYAVKSACISPALYSNHGPQQSSILMKYLMSLLGGSDDSELLNLEQRLKGSNPKHIRSNSTLVPLLSIVDGSVEVPASYIHLLALESLLQLFAFDDAVRLHHATRDFIKYAGKLRKLTPSKHHAPDSWTSTLLEIISRSIPINNRFHVVDSLLMLMESCEASVLSIGDNHHVDVLILLGLTSALISARVNLIGLSTVDVLERLIAIKVKIEGGPLVESINLYETALVDCVCALALHNYYSGQIEDLLYALFTRTLVPIETSKELSDQVLVQMVNSILSHSMQSRGQAGPAIPDLSRLSPLLTCIEQPEQFGTTVALQLLYSVVQHIYPHDRGSSSMITSVAEYALLLRLFSASVRTYGFWSDQDTLVLSWQRLLECILSKIAESDVNAILETCQEAQINASDKTKTWCTMIKDIIKNPDLSVDALRPVKKPSSDWHRAGPEVTDFYKGLHALLLDGTLETSKPQATECASNMPRNLAVHDVHGKQRLSAIEIEGSEKPVPLLRTQAKTAKHYGRIKLYKGALGHIELGSVLLDQRLSETSTTNCFDLFDGLSLPTLGIAERAIVRS